jgi:hypothetical protein
MSARRFSRLSSSRRNSTEHIVRRQRASNALERELAHRLDLHGALDLHQHSRADQDLSWLGLIAKTGGDVGHCADGGIIEASLKADGPERGKSVRNPDAEANVVPQATPRFGQRSDCLAHFKRHEHSLERRVIYWDWIVEDDHHAVTGVAFERAAVFDDNFADCRMVVAQQPSRLPGPHFRRSR